MFIETNFIFIIALPFKAIINRTIVGKKVNILLALCVSIILNMSGILRILYNPNTLAGQYSPIITPLVVFILCLILGVSTFNRNVIKANHKFYFYR